MLKSNDFAIIKYLASNKQWIQRLMLRVRRSKENVP